MINYTMFIDDERDIQDVTWIKFPSLFGKQIVTVCRNMDEVKQIVLENGLPSCVSFDHDLGENQPTGFDIAKWMVSLELDGINKFPEEFQYSVHSKNPIGEENIRGFLTSYFKQRDL